MATQQRPLSPHLQVYRPMYTTVLSILHRASGLALSATLLLLAGWLVALAAGPDAYGLLMSVYAAPLGRLICAAIVVAFWYHFCAGIRHLVFDTGRCMEKAEARRSAVVVIVATLVLAGGTLAVMLFGGAHS